MKWPLRVEDERGFARAERIRILVLLGFWFYSESI